MADPVALNYTAAPPPRPSDPLAFTAATMSVMGLVFLPLAPFGCLLGLIALITFRRRTPMGRAMAVVAVLVGLIGSAGLVGVVLWVQSLEPTTMTAGGK